MRDRVDWIDSAKGFTMLLVIIGHCVDGYINAHMFPNLKLELQFTYDFLYSFHMPLFFILSGFLYYYTYSGANLRKIVDKASELIMLYFGYSIVQCLIQIAMAGRINRNVTFNDIFLLPIYTVPPYWYLYVLAFLYIISYAFRPLNPVKLIISLILCVISVFGIHISAFSISDIAFYFLFFTIGGLMALKRFDLRFKKGHFIILLFVYIVVVLLGSVSGLGKILRALLLSLIVLSVFCSFSSIKSIRLFNLCGKYCLPIYLLHSYLTAGTRVVLKAIQCDNILLYLSSGMVLGVVLPITVYKICSFNKCLEWVFRPSLLFCKSINN